MTFLCEKYPTTIYQCNFNLIPDLIFYFEFFEKKRLHIDYRYNPSRVCSYESGSFSFVCFCLVSYSFPHPSVGRMSNIYI